MTTLPGIYPLLPKTSTHQQLRMLLSQPCEYIIAQSNRKLVQFTGLPLGSNAGRLITPDVAFLAKSVKALNLRTGPATLALARSRSTIASSAVISSRLFSCSTSQLFLCQSRKLTVVPNQKDLLAFQHRMQKMMLGGKFGAKVRGRIDRRVDLAPD